MEHHQPVASAGNAPADDYEPVNDDPPADDHDAANGCGPYNPGGELPPLVPTVPHDRQ